MHEGGVHNLGILSRPLELPIFCQNSISEILWSWRAQPFATSFKPGDDVEELELEGATVLVNVLLEMKQFTKVGSWNYRLGNKLYPCTQYNLAF